MIFHFVNNPDTYTANVFSDSVRIGRLDDVTGQQGAQSMALDTFYAIAALVAAADPGGPLGAVQF